jgi:hypothetical protein
MCATGLGVRVEYSPFAGSYSRRRNSCGVVALNSRHERAWRYGFTRRHPAHPIKPVNPTHRASRSARERRVEREAREAASGEGEGGEGGRQQGLDVGPLVLYKLKFLPRRSPVHVPTPCPHPHRTDRRWSPRPPRYPVVPVSVPRASQPTARLRSSRAARVMCCRPVPRHHSPPDHSPPDHSSSELCNEHASLPHLLDPYSTLALGRRLHHHVARDSWWTNEQVQSTRREYTSQDELHVRTPEPCAILQQSELLRADVVTGDAVPGGVRQH